MALLGILAGWAGTILAKRVIHEFYPTLAVKLTVEWALWAALLAFAGALLGGLYPAIRAAQADPVDALGYE
jgi:putative ABC transport system permease protein